MKSNCPVSRGSFFVKGTPLPEDRQKALKIFFAVGKRENKR